MKIKKYFRWGFAIILGIIAAAYAPANMLCDITQEVIALLGLMMAAVLPTMILTASVLRPGGMSKAKINDYRNALITQTRVWAGLFLWSLVACVFILIGKLLNWQWSVKISRIGNFELIYIINSIIYISSFLIAMRVGSIVSGIISLINLSADIAISEINPPKTIDFDANDITSPPDRGNYI